MLFLSVSRMRRLRTLIMRTQVQGCVRNSATEKANIALYLEAEGDFEDSSRNVRNRQASIVPSMLA